MDNYRASKEPFQIELIVGSNDVLGPSLSAEARAYARESRSENTRRAYLTDTTQFTRWCLGRRLTPLPAESSTIANYLSWLADSGRRVATLERALAAISQAHRMAGFASPRSDDGLKAVMKGIRRAIGVAPVRKSPVVVTELQRMAEAIPCSLKGVRDRALLVLGFAGAFRRSELVALDAADLNFTGDGLEVGLRSSKTDQEGRGAKIGVPYGGHPGSCPVRCVQAWLKVAGIVEGPIFRPVDRHGNISSQRLTPRAVANVVKACAELAGLDPRKYSGHSLRAGLITSAVRAGKSEALVMRQSRHKSIAVFRTYVRDTDLFRENAAAGLGL
jgi:site-specific recombinase XerD